MGMVALLTTSTEKMNPLIRYSSLNPERWMMAGRSGLTELAYHVERLLTARSRPNDTPSGLLRSAFLPVLADQHIND
jgi:hypothetical protein